jgi:F-type H+-transporting ATPase subunit a
MIESPLATHVLFHLGPVPVTAPVVTTWGLMAALAGGAFLATRRLSPQRPGRLQAALELLVTGIAGEIRAISPRGPERFLPLVGSLFVFLVFANMLSVLPGLEAPTAQVETPAALAIVVFLAVHWYGVRSLGPRRYLAHFARPVWVMLPLNVLEEFTRTFSMTVRLFGNMMSGAFVGALVLSLAGLLVPVPLMALELLMGLVQAYIFSVLAMVYIAAGVGGTEGA